MKIGIDIQNLDQVMADILLADIKCLKGSLKELKKQKIKGSRIQDLENFTEDLEALKIAYRYYSGKHIK
jgi:hypothetical protein